MGPGEELVLRVATDLNDGDVGEAGVDELLHCLDGRTDVVTAWDLLGHVLFTHALRGGREVLGGRQLRIDVPAAAEPAELLVRALAGNGLIRVVGETGL